MSVSPAILNACATQQRDLSAFHREAAAAARSRAVVMAEMYTSGGKTYAVEAALVARKVDANKLLSILRGECVFLDTTHTKQAADCIGELAEALKIARTVVDPARSPNTCDYIDATVEKWGLK